VRPPIYLVRYTFGKELAAFDGFILATKGCYFHDFSHLETGQGGWKTYTLDTTAWPATDASLSS
jgi:hypothetical protein